MPKKPKRKSPIDSDDDSADAPEAKRKKLDDDSKDKTREHESEQFTTKDSSESNEHVTDLKV